MLKILHVLDHSIPLQSGYAFRTQSILNEQRRLGWVTSHITSPKHVRAAGYHGKREHVDGYDFERTPVPGRVWTRVPPLEQWATMRILESRLESFVREIMPDVLHAHSPALNGEAAMRVGRRLGIPLVYEVRAFWEDAAVNHGTCFEGSLRYRLTRAWESRVLEKADAVTTICEGLRTEILKRGLPADKVSIIPNAVDTDRFSVRRQVDPALATALGLKGRTVLGFIGSFYAYEGLDLLISALPQISAAHPEVCVLLVGGGPQESLLREQVQQANLSDRVCFTGRVAHEEVHRYYDLVDIFVYPRAAIRLTELVTPLKPLEAMAKSRLVVASDVGGHRELIRHGETGFLFKADDPRDLAQRVAELLGRRERWEVICAAARRFVETERSWAMSVARYTDVYAKLIDPRLATVALNILK